MTLSFGTDGVRGRANTELTPEFVLALGRASARVLADGRGPFVIGRDTRISGPMLQAALAAGVASEGVDVYDLGVIPTPGVAAVSALYGAAGAVVSASHNPYWDNGVKVFAPGGRKLADEEEQRLEAELATIVGGSTHARPADASVGQIGTDPSATEHYANQLLASLNGRKLGGLRVVVDCANGAASRVGPAVLTAAGAEVTAIHDAPDGQNINAGCGSTEPAAAASAVRESGADVGIAFDGDADRLVAVDGSGNVVDGDKVIALCALDLQARGKLAGNAVAVTVMSNLGLHKALEAAGVRVIETPVGDRYVLEAMDKHGVSIGGEQSGHIIFRDLATTGDGILTALQLLDLVVRRGESLADLATKVMTTLPQVLRNVVISDRGGLEGATAIWDEVSRVEHELTGRGRVLLRPSGTEPLVRVMVEAPTQQEAASAADRLCAVIENTLAAR